MKTTVELPDALLREVKEVARASGTSMRELIIEGLRAELARRRTRPRADFAFPSVGVAGSNSWPDLTHGDLIAMAYGDRG